MADFEWLAPGGHKRLVDNVVGLLADKPDSEALSPLLTAGAALGITGEATDSAAWLQRVSEADGVASVRSIHGNTIVQDGALVPVNMTGIETTGFNQWDEVWELGVYNTSNGNKGAGTSSICATNMVPVMPSTSYYMLVPHTSVVSGFAVVLFYDADGAYLHSYTQVASNGMTFTVPSDAYYLTFYVSSQYGTTYNHDICVNISDPTRNGEYEPYWQQQRTIPAGTLRSAGSVYDEQTATERIVRIGEVDLGTLTWNHASSDSPFWYAVISDAMTGALTDQHLIQCECAAYTPVQCQATSTMTTDKTICIQTSFQRVLVRDESHTASTVEQFTEAVDGIQFQYWLATPTVTPYDLLLNLTYRTAAGGVERVMVPAGENSAPPTLVTAQGYTAESLRDAALSTIAPVENGLASTNYAVGSYLVHGGQLCRVTTAIATGEAISIGTNVTATTVMAEILSLVQ